MYRLVATCDERQQNACLEKTYKLVGKADRLLTAEPFHSSLTDEICLFALTNWPSFCQKLTNVPSGHKAWMVSCRRKAAANVEKQADMASYHSPEPKASCLVVGKWECEDIWMQRTKHINTESWCTLNRASLLFMNPHSHSQGSADNFHLCTFLSLFPSAVVWVEMCHACMAHWKFRCFLSKTEMQCWPLSQKESFIVVPNPSPTRLLVSPPPVTSDSFSLESSLSDQH